MIQTDRLLIIQRRQSQRVWCEACGLEVDVVGLTEAQALTGTTKTLLPGTAAPGGWHVCPDQDGEPRICLQSLMKSG